MKIDVSLFDLMVSDFTKFWLGDVPVFAFINETDAVTVISDYGADSVRWCFNGDRDGSDRGVWRAESPGIIQKSVFKLVSPSC